MFRFVKYAMPADQEWFQTVLAESEEDALYKASRLPDQVRCDYFERVFRLVSSRVVESNA